MKLHRYIDHGWQMTPIDFQVTRVRIRKVHGDIDHDRQMTPIDFQDSRKKSSANSVDPDETPHDAAKTLRLVTSEDKEATTEVPKTCGCKPPVET
ncbi:hypothetical protein DPMN_094558 [Dreissena polymorpha]|uniref:Uncharacterized protein n=1 Tax=Dreissena polymorpha TaxID=45954 RepID=A0A9D4L6C8_DREPO|nr:hypothetical protein DPMN_094558 [Dreissena polymorpha]